jgi:hemerythrin
MLHWTEQHSTGSPELDHQHQVLIDKINGLGKALLANNPTLHDYQCMISMVDFVEVFADEHFGVEEKCMEQFRCPLHAKNKEAHEQFRKFVASFRQECKTQGIRRELIMKLQDTLSQWVENHILKVDAKLKLCIKG